MITTHSQAALIQEFVDAIADAVRQFGSYSYNDKGPHEIMDVGALQDKIQSLAPEVAASVLRSVANATNLPVNPVALSEMILIDLQHWDALFEQPGMVDAFSGEVPAPEAGDWVTSPSALVAKKSKP